jgi:hypothetical protein
MNANVFGRRDLVPLEQRLRNAWLACKAFCVKHGMGNCKIKKFTKGMLGWAKKQSTYPVLTSKAYKNKVAQRTFLFSFSAFCPHLCI